MAISMYAAGSGYDAVTDYCKQDNKNWTSIKILRFTIRL